MPLISVLSQFIKKSTWVSVFPVTSLASRGTSLLIVADLLMLKLINGMPVRCQCYKTFSLVTDTYEKARVFAPGKFICFG